MYNMLTNQGISWCREKWPCDAVDTNGCIIGSIGEWIGLCAPWPDSMINTKSMLTLFREFDRKIEHYIKQQQQQHPFS